MKGLRALEERFGGRWTGVKFHYDAAPEVPRRAEPVRLCEAIAGSYTVSVVLTPEIVECPGARRSLGWAPGQDEALAAAMADKSGLAPEVARGLISGTPSLRAAPLAVTIGKCDEPDVALCYAQPEMAMALVRGWQAMTGKTLLAEVSSVMAVCGSVAVRAHLTGQMCMSFGCPDSRQYGAISRDRLVVGLPMSLAGELTS